MAEKKSIHVEILAEEKLFPASLVQSVFNKAAHSYNAHSFIVHEIGTRLMDRIFDTNRTFPRILDLGAGTGLLQKITPAPHGAEAFISADFSEEMLKQAEGAKVLLNAEELLPFADESFDLILSNLMLPWVNDVPKCLYMAGKALKKDGLFLASTLGSGSFLELKEAFHATGASTPHTLPLPDLSSVGGALQSVGFALPVVDRDTITITYPNFEAIYADAKALGAINLNPHRTKGLTTKTVFEKMEAYYKANFAQEDGSLPLTLEIIYLHGWRPHFSQQKPAARGSATVSLTEALGKK